MLRLVLSAFFAFTVISGTFVANAPARAAGDPAVCLKTCIDQYGADKKQSCALQCGYGQNQMGGGAQKDCGQIYKQCIRSCGNDKSCKDTCRSARTSCY